MMSSRQPMNRSSLQEQYNTPQAPGRPFKPNIRLSKFALVIKPTFVAIIRAEDVPTGTLFPKQSIPHVQDLNNTRRLPTDVDFSIARAQQQREIGRVYLVRLFECNGTGEGWNEHMQLELFSLLESSVASRIVDLGRLDGTKRVSTRCGPAIKLTGRCRSESDKRWALTQVDPLDDRRF
ncbi:hypothetical protein BDV93DRAFT_309006 [Ceratobasidium sp. AG-I]|nr:hypothetical protein BDV93DRAFT_309006 [Ceratobasidium sp. AG-I]